MANVIDTNECRASYDDVRDDNTETNWAAFTYKDDRIVPGGQGTEFEDFKNLCTEDARVFGFVRVMTGDSMSKRSKFAFITWIGEGVLPLKRAKVSTDKAFVKTVVQNYAKEFMMNDPKELCLEYLTDELKKAGGANYDAQAK